MIVFVNFSQFFMNLMVYRKNYLNPKFLEKFPPPFELSEWGFQPKHDIFELFKLNGGLTETTHFLIFRPNQGYLQHFLNFRLKMNMLVCSYVSSYVCVYDCAYVFANAIGFFCTQICAYVFPKSVSKYVFISQSENKGVTPQPWQKNQ